MNYREAINSVSGCRYIHALTADKVEAVYFRRGNRVYSLLGSSVGWSINREESLATTVAAARPVRALDESTRLVIAMAEVLEAVSENDMVRAEHNDRQIARIDGLREERDRAIAAKGKAVHDMEEMGVEYAILEGELTKERQHNRVMRNELTQARQHLVSAENALHEREDEAIRLRQWLVESYVVAGVLTFTTVVFALLWAF